MQVEQFYADDQDKTRELFLQAVARLKTIPRADWFVVRNYEKPPPVLAALMSAVCTLMLVRDTWKSARSLVGSSSQNMKVRVLRVGQTDRASRLGPDELYRCIKKVWQPYPSRTWWVCPAHLANDVL